MTGSGSLGAFEDAARLRAVLDSAVDGVITIDERGTVEAANPAAERLFGYSASELVGRNIRMLMPPPYRDEHDSYLENYLRTGVRKIIGQGREVTGLRKDRSTFPLYLAVSETDFGDRRVFTGSLHDLSALRDAEHRSAQLGRILEESLNEIYIFDAETLRFVMVNQGAVRNIGYSADEILQLTPPDIKPEYTLERFRDLLRPLASGEVSLLQLETVHRRRDGTTYNVMLRLHRTVWQERDAFVAIILDITAHKTVREQLLQSERLAAIGQMVAGLAHESRNALQRAQACLDMLSLDLEDQPEQLELTEKTRRALTDLHRYYEEVRNYAAPISLDRRLTDLKQLWRSTWRDLEPIRFGRTLTLVEADNDMDLTCDVDEHRLEQVFRNIMENAVAACPDPGRLKIICAPCEQRGQPAVEIRFRDNGPGFRPEAAVSVFEPFFTTKQKGTGLGMAIARRIVDAHGGRIDATTAANGGADVRVVLPRRKPVA